MPDTCDSRCILFDGSLKSMSIFASPVAFRARCWFPFSPCSLNMPWPGFPHVVRMIHRYGLHWSFICYLTLPCPLSSPLTPSPFQNKAPSVLPDLTAWCLWAFFFYTYIYIFLFQVMHVASSHEQDAQQHVFLSFPPPLFFFFFVEGDISWGYDQFVRGGFCVCLVEENLNSDCSALYTISPWWPALAFWFHLL